MVVDPLPLPISTILDYAAMSYEEHDCRVGEVECIVDQSEDLQIVAVRGTEGRALLTGLGLLDVIRNVRVIPWYDKRVGWAHSGFLKGAQGIVGKGLFGMLDKRIPIIFVGHSAGGAIALAAASILHAEEFDVQAVITFGCPRVLTKGSVEKYKQKRIQTIQYSNPGDPIPDLPSKWWTRYRHVNEQFTSRQNRTYSITGNHMLKHYGEAFNV